MINLLKAEFFKAVKSKSMYVCTILMVLFVLFTYGLFYMMVQVQKEAVESGVMVMEEGMEDYFALSNEGVVFNIIQEMFTDMGAIIVTVFAAIFVIREYGRGAVKNIVGKGYPRWKIFLSKYISTVLLIVVMYLVMEIATMIFGAFFIDHMELNSAFWQNFLQYSGIQFLLAIAMTGIIILIGELSRNMGIGISVGICVLMFSNLLTSGLDMLFHKTDFKVSDYWIMNLAVSCPTGDIGSSFAVRAILSALVWIVVIFAIGLLHFRKADIK